MRKIYYEKREIKKHGYITVNAELSEDPSWPIQEANIHGPGFKMTDVYADYGYRDIADCCEYNTSKPDTEAGCRAVLRGMPSDWKIAAVRVEWVNTLEIFFVNEKAYNEVQLNGDNGDHYITERYNTWASLKNVGDGRLYTLEFELPDSADSLITKYRIRLGSYFVEVEEFEKHRKRSFTFTAEADDTNHENERQYVSETECIY